MQKTNCFYLVKKLNNNNFNVRAFSLLLYRKILIQKEVKKYHLGMIKICIKKELQSKLIIKNKSGEESITKRCTFQEPKIEVQAI